MTISFLRSTSTTSAEEESADDSSKKASPNDKKSFGMRGDEYYTGTDTEDEEGGGPAANNKPSLVYATKGECDDDDDEIKRTKDSFFCDSLVNQQMESFKEHACYDMEEDVYAFIVAAPVLSWPFLFSLYVIGTKYVVYCTLFSTKSDMREMDGSLPQANAVKFFLIPVAIAMQADLMQVYATIANTRYSSDALSISKSATFPKFCFAYALRFIDGLASLLVNFLVMMETDGVMEIFLNFAALHFLQDIDDVFYNLVEKGFFGDRLEFMSTVCKQISWPRRIGNEDCWKSNFITSLDTICFAVTFLILLALYISSLVCVKYGCIHQFH